MNYNEKAHLKVCFFLLTFLLYFISFATKRILKNYHKQHFEAFLTKHGVRMSCRHNDAFALFENILLAVYRDFPNAVKTGYESVSARLVRTDLFSLVKREYRDRNGVVLRQRFAHDLPVLICYLLFERQNFRFGNILHPRKHNLP